MGLGQVPRLHLTDEKIKPREVQQLIQRHTAHERPSSQKDPGLLASVLVTVCALRHLNERMISLWVKGSDQHGQRLNGKAASEARLFCHLRALLPSTQRTPEEHPRQSRSHACLLSLKSQGYLTVVEAAERVLQARRQDGWLEKMPRQTASVLLTADSKSLSPRVSKGCQLIHLNLSASVGSNSILSTCTDNDPGPCTGDMSLLGKMGFSLLHT